MAHTNIYTTTVVFDANG